MTFVFLAFLLSAIIQGFFQLFFLFQLAKYKAKEHILDIEDKPVSVIVCSHNALISLKGLIEKLAVQAYRNYEIVVVDDRSGDGTYDYLKEKEKQLSILRCVRVDWTPNHVNEKKYALTLGIKAARNDLVLLTDADCEPVSTNWIKGMVNQFDDHTDIVLGFSYYKKCKGFLNLFIRHETLQTGLLYLAFALSGNPYMGVGRNLSYRRSFFFSKNGFNGILKVVGGDDDLFVNRHAHKNNTGVAIHPDVLVLSAPKKRFRDYFIQKMRHLAAGKKYRKKHQVLLLLFSLSKLGFWVLGILSLSCQYQVYWTLIIIFLTLGLSLWSFRYISKKFRVKYELGWVWLMDFVYISYLAVFSLAAFSSKKIKWS